MDSILRDTDEILSVMAREAAEVNKKGDACVSEEEKMSIHFLESLPKPLANQGSQGPIPSTTEPRSKSLPEMMQSKCKGKEIATEEVRDTPQGKLGIEHSNSFMVGGILMMAQSFAPPACEVLRPVPATLTTPAFSSAE
jgi:hypothetical protein